VKWTVKAINRVIHAKRPIGVRLTGSPFNPRVFQRQTLDAVYFRIVTSTSLAECSRRLQCHHHYVRPWWTDWPRWLGQTFLLANISVYQRFGKKDR